MLRPLRLRLSMTKEILRNFAPPKTDIMRLCATELFARHCKTQRYVVIIATKNGYVAILCEQINCATLCVPKQKRCDFPARSLRFLFRTNRPKMVGFDRLDPGSISFDRLDPTSCLCFDYVRPRRTFQPSSTEDVTFRPSSTREKRPMLRLCAIQIRYVAILHNPIEVCCDHCDSKWVCCDFTRQKKTYETLCDKKTYVAALRDPN